jgi:hypothetical protein
MNKNSNDIKTDIHHVCTDCGIEANRLTCLKKYGKEPLQKAFSVSTFHKGICDNCKEEKMITETRDFFYPDFSLLQPNSVKEKELCECGDGSNKNYMHFKYNCYYL